jgi:hypothetical protein
MNPSEFPEVKPYPSIVKFLQKNVDMLFADMRSMLKHPLREGEGGCNFALFNFICDVISGISITLYKPEELCKVYLGKKGRPTDFATELMKEHYPWEEEGITPEEKDRVVKVIWNVRHSLTHRIGIALPQEKGVSIDKPPRGCTDDKIEKLEDLSKQIEIKAIKEVGDLVHVNVLGFYRGLHKMLRNLCKNEKQMQRANEFWGKVL